MDHDVARQILDRHLEEYRAWSHRQLASEIDETRRKHDCLHAVEGRTPGREPYFVEINVLSDDRPGGDVRVIGELSSLAAARRGCLYGLLPVFTPDVVRCFIMASDGTLIGE